MVNKTAAEPLNLGVWRSTGDNRDYPIKVQRDEHGCWWAETPDGRLWQHGWLVSEVTHD